MVLTGDIVFVLYHEHADDSLEGGVDSKMIGIYATQAAAANAKDRIGKLEGFRESREGFLIASVQLDDSRWDGHIKIF